MRYVLTERHLKNHSMLSINESGSNDPIESYRVTKSDKPDSKYNWIKKYLTLKVSTLNGPTEQPYSLWAQIEPDNRSTIWIKKWDQIIYSVRYSPQLTNERLKHFQQQIDLSNDRHSDGLEPIFSFIPDFPID